jgi:hypothetical protein
VPVGRLREQGRRDRRLMIEAIGVAIAQLIPSKYRGVYGDAVFRHAAAALSAHLFGSSRSS